MMHSLLAYLSVSSISQAEVNHHFLGKIMPANTNSLDSTGLSSDPEMMIKLASYRMPFGKYKGSLLIDLPEPYVVWFANKGFPAGELGMLLGIVHTIKVNGLEYLFYEKSQQKN